MSCSVWLTQPAHGGKMEGWKKKSDKTGKTGQAIIVVQRIGGDEKERIWKHIDIVITLEADWR